MHTTKLSLGRFCRRVQPGSGRPVGKRQAVGFAELPGVARNFLVVLAVALIGGTAWAADDDARPNRPGDDARENFRQKMLKEFDADRNGKLDEDELALARQAMAQRRRGPNGPAVDFRELIKRFDKDGDGRLDEKERQAAKRSFAGTIAGGRRPGSSTQGRPGAPGRPEDRALMLKRFDKDGDGKLDATELAAAKAAFANRPGRPDAARRPDGARPDTTRPASPRPGGAPLRGGEFMRRFDKDGNGKLDETERAAARAAFAARQNSAGYPPVEPKPDKGRVNKQELLKEFDADGDGKLTGDERAAARKAFEERNQGDPNESP